MKNPINLIITATIAFLTITSTHTMTSKFLMKHYDVICTSNPSLIATSSGLTKALAPLLGHPECNERGITSKQLAITAEQDSFKSTTHLKLYNATDEDLALVAQRCDPKKLVVLDLGWCFKITNTGLQHLSGLTKLQTLIILWCREISNPSLKTLAKFTDLQELHLSWGHHLTDDTVTVIAQNCPRLISLSLLVCFKLSNPSIKSATLRNLCLRDCYHLTDDALTSITQNCPNLIHLDISGCSQLTNPTIKSENLTSIELLRITDDAIAAITRNCPHLITIRVGGDSFTDEGLKNITENCPYLRALNVSDSSKINNPEITSKSLEHLYFFDCIHLTDDAVKAIIKNCPCLKNFNAVNTQIVLCAPQTRKT